MKINWILLSLIGLFSLSVMSFLITSLTRKGYPTSFVLLGIGIIFTIFYSFQTFALLKYRPEFRLEVFALLLLIGLLSAIGNVALFQAANNAPNAGLAIAIGAGMQSGLVALLAFIFLKDKMSPLQIIGLILSVVAVILITSGNSTSKNKLSAKSTNKVDSK